MKKLSIAVAALVTCGWLAPQTLEARSAGISGQAKAGCGGAACHVGAADPAVAVTLGAPATFTPGGEPEPLLVTLSGGPASDRGGFDLRADAGSVAPDPLHPSGTDLSQWGAQEVSHSFLSSFRREWAATWTPPAIGTLCAIPISVSSNAVNGNFTNDVGDRWNKTATTVAADTSADQAPPTGAFRTPQPGTVHVGDSPVAPVGVTVVFGALYVQITANDDLGIASVALFDEDLTGRQKVGNGAYQGLTEGNTKNLFRVYWDALPEPPGPHTLTAEITDCAGNVTAIDLEVFVL